MGSKALRIPDRLTVVRDQFEVFDDFDWYVITHLWTDLQADAASTVGHEGPGRSRLKLLSSVDNEEAAVSTVNELFKFIADKSLYCEGLIQQTKPNTDDGSMAFGFGDAIGADFITDDGTAMGINDSGAVIYTLKNESVWRFQTEIGGVAVTTTSTTSSVSSTGQTLAIDITPRSSTVFVARPFVDGVQLRDANGVPISHDITLGTSTDMDFGVYQKGHHADDYIVYVDYLYAAQVR